MQPEEEITPGEKDVRKATPEDLAAEIDRTRETVLRRCGAAIASMIEIGRLMGEAREILEEEALLAWLKGRVGMTPRLSARYVELATDPAMQRKALSGLISGALGLNLCDEVVLPPSPAHMVKGRDMNNVTLYLWPADPRAERLHAIAMDRTPGKPPYWEGLRNPLLAGHVARILVDRPPCGFHFSNAHFEILPAGPDDLARLDDMLARYIAKSEANGEDEAEI